MTKQCGSAPFEAFLQRFSKLGFALASLCVAPAALAAPVAPLAVSVTTLHAFVSATEGEVLQAALLEGSDGNLYGVASQGGLGSGGGAGSVFEITTSGTLVWVHLFTTTDGANPQGALMQAIDGNLYGTTSAGGAGSSGTIYRVTPSGTLTSVHSFASYQIDNSTMPPSTTSANADGADPISALIQGSDGTFYGTTLNGGPGGGIVFKMSLNGTPNPTLTTLHRFNFNEGELPTGPVLGFDGNIYGSTSLYGPGADGTAANGSGASYQYQLTGSPVSGSEFSILHAFDGSLNGTANSKPTGPLIQASDGNFWGTAAQGPGASGHGGIFKLTPGGAAQDPLTFADGSPYFNDVYDGVLQASDGNFYAVTPTGSSGCGALYRLTPAGVATKLYDFGTNAGDPCNPVGALIQGRDGELYGTSKYGGSTSEGTVYKVTLSPALPSPVITSDVSVAVSGNKTDANPAANGEGPAGVYSFNAKFCNVQAHPLSGLLSRTVTLSNSNSLINRSVGSSDPKQPGGAGSRLVFAHSGAYAGGALPQKQCLTVPYQIGLKTLSKFTFTVDLLGGTN